MVESIYAFGFCFHVGIIFVNLFVAVEKNRNMLGIGALSLFFAPFVYLYLLAVPPKEGK